MTAGTIQADPIMRMDRASLIDEVLRLRERTHELQADYSRRASRLQAQVDYWLNIMKEAQRTLSADRHIIVSEPLTEKGERTCFSANVSSLGLAERMLNIAYREALEFYAQDALYESERWPTAHSDHGHTAREALHLRFPPEYHDRMEAFDVPLVNAAEYDGIRVEHGEWTSTVFRVENGLRVGPILGIFHGGNHERNAVDFRDTMLLRGTGS